MVYFFSNKYVSLVTIITLLCSSGCSTTSPQKAEPSNSIMEEMFTLDEPANTPHTPLEHLKRAEKLVSQNKLDPAIIHFEYALIQPEWSKQDPQGWYSGFQSLMATALIRKESPTLAMEMISRLVDAGSIPQNLDGEVPYWRSEIIYLKNDLARLEAPNDPELKKDRGLIQLVSRLVEQSEQYKLKQKPSRGFFSNLRAFSLLNQYQPNSNRKAQTLYLAAKVRENLAGVYSDQNPREIYQLCSEVDSLSRFSKLCEKKLGSSNESSAKLNSN